MGNKISESRKTLLQILETIFLEMMNPMTATEQIVIIQAYCDPGTTPDEKKFTQ